MREVIIEKVSDTELRRVIKEVKESIVVDLNFLADRKVVLQNQKQQIIDDFDGRIAEIDAQIAEARTAGVKTYEEAGVPDPKKPKTVVRKD